VKICFTEFVEVNPRHHFSCNDDLLTDFANFLSPGTANRTVASTQMNATSSRAHTVVTITFDQIQKNEAGQETKKSSSINLVDLAGDNSSCVSCTSNQFLYRLCLRWPSVLILCLIEVKECLFSLPLDYMHVAVATSSVQIRNSTSFLKRFKIFVFATYVVQATADLSKYCLCINVVFVQSSKTHQSYDSIHSSANVAMVGILRFLTYLFS